MDDRIERLEKEIQEIKNRNKKVEADKTWETSITRKVFIAISTYLLIFLFMVMLGIDRPFISSLIPAVAYLISTASLEKIKSKWLQKQNS
jgi:hypothetical protein